MTQQSGLAAPTVKSSGWCSIVADVDNDGWKDIFTANSHVNDRIGDFEALEFRQPNSLFVNDGRGRFRDATAAAGLAATIAAHRGCGIADFNGDGRLDLVVVSLGSPAELWQNDSAPASRWLIVRLAGTKSNRDGIGARVIVGDQVRTMTTAMGYASSSHAGLHFGLGAAAGPVRVEVQWPSGIRQTIENVEVNQSARRHGALTTPNAPTANSQREPVEQLGGSRTTSLLPRLSTRGSTGSPWELAVGS